MDSSRLWRLAAACRLALAFLFIAALSRHAAAADASLRGTIVDQLGSQVSTATVTLTRERRARRHRHERCSRRASSRGTDGRTLSVEVTAAGLRAAALGARVRRRRRRPAVQVTLLRRNARGSMWSSRRQRAKWRVPVSASVTGVDARAARRASATRIGSSPCGRCRALRVVQTPRAEERHRCSSAEAPPTSTRS